MHFYMLSQGYEPTSSESLKMYESNPERVFRDEVALFFSLLEGSNDVISLDLSLFIHDQGRIQDFFQEGGASLLLYFNTNKPHSFFFAEYQLY